MPDLVTHDGAQLHYEVHGTGPRDVLLLHGMGGTLRMWDSFLSQLNPVAFRAVAVDLRGHGKSKGGEERFTFAHVHADLLAVLDAVAMPQPTVVAQSGSGKNAVWLAVKAPARVGGLVLVAPCGMGCLPFDRAMIGATFDHIGRHGVLPPLFDGFFTDKIGAHRAAVDRDYAGTARMVLDATAELWVYTSIEEEVAGVGAPTLVVAGARDMFYAPEFQRRATLPFLPQARMEALECGHYVPFEEPAALAGMVRDFCAGV